MSEYAEKEEMPSEGKGKRLLNALGGSLLMGAALTNCGKNDSSYHMVPAYGGMAILTDKTADGDGLDK